MSSQPQTTKCLRCGNSDAPIGLVCGRLFDLDDELEPCDEINFARAERACSFELEFEGQSQTLVAIKEGINNGQQGFYPEIVWDSTGLCFEADDAAPFTFLGRQITNSIISNSSLPIAFESGTDFYRLRTCQLEPRGEGLGLKLEIEAWFWSLQSDWHEHGPKSLKEYLARQETIGLEIDGERLTPFSVKIIDW